jgi:hypothetical protein
MKEHLNALYVTYDITPGYKTKDSKTPLYFSLCFVFKSNSEILKIEQRGIEEYGGEKFLDVYIIHENQALLKDVQLGNPKWKFSSHFIKDMTLEDLIKSIETETYDAAYNTHSGHQIMFAQNIVNHLNSQQYLKNDETTTNIIKYLTDNNSKIVHNVQDDEYHLSS